MPDRFLPTLCALLSLLFVPGLMGAATTPRWALLSVAVPLLLIGCWRSVCWSAAHWVALLALLYAAASGLWSEVLPDWMDAFWQACILFGTFLIGSVTKDTAPTYKAVAWTVLLVHLPLTVAQQLGWDSIPQTVAPASLFANRNIMAEFMLISVVAMFSLRQWFFMAAPLYCLLAAQERAALVTLAVLAFLWGFSSLPQGLLRRAGLAACAAVFLIGLVAWEGLHRPTAAQGSVDYRLAMWKDTLRGITPLGHGLGSYYTISPKYNHDTDSRVLRNAYAHDEPLHYAFELGCGAVLLAACGALCLGYGGAGADRLVLLSLLLVGAFAFPFHLPATAFLGALAAGRLAGRGPPLRYFLLARGMATARTDAAPVFFRRGSL